VPGLDLEGLLRKKQIVICCGSGGVGKTTVSAALGVQAALLGKKVLALTVDPAKRLADSLGLKELGNEQTRLPQEKFRLCGRDPTGSLHAMMLDTKRTFDELIERYAPSQDVARNILNNPFYRNLSSAMAGSHEYLAMEKLYQLHLSGRYDLIVLDTPPTKHAMDFLEAPSRVRAFFDRRISQWFLKPYLTMGRIGVSLLNRTAGTVLRLVERFTGAEFLHHVSEFVTGLSDSFDIFQSRAEEVMHVLRGDQASFLLVTGTDRNALEEAAYFYGRIQEASLPFGGVIVNRFHTLPVADETDPALASRSNGDGNVLADPFLTYLSGERGLPLPVVQQLEENFARFRLLSRRDQTILQEFAKRLSRQVPILTVPAFDEDILDLDGLLRINAHLFPSVPAGPLSS
jgi:anion-transporting  ArsA/GET3 family ATPase